MNDSSVYRKQRLSQGQKNKEKKKWYKNNIDLLDNRSFSNQNGSNYYDGVNEYKRMRINYDLYNNIIDIRDFEYVCKPYGAESGELPANMTNRDIISAKIKALEGMEMIHDTIICNSDVNAELIKVLLGKGAKLETEDITLQNLTRYIPVKTGYKLIKVIPPLKGKTATREIGIDKDYEHLPINDLRGIDLVELKERINLDYYLNKINQIIEKIE